MKFRKFKLQKYEKRIKLYSKVELEDAMDMVKIFVAHEQFISGELLVGAGVGLLFIYAGLHPYIVEGMGIEHIGKELIDKGGIIIGVCAPLLAQLNYKIKTNKKKSEILDNYLKKYANSDIKLPLNEEYIDSLQNEEVTLIEQKQL